MPLKLYRRGRIWWYSGTVRKQTVRESTGTSDREAAEAVRVQRENELLQRSVFGARATATFLEAAVMYLESGRSPRFVGKLIDHLGHKKLLEIDQETVDETARVLHPNATPATRVRQVYVPITAILNRAAKAKLCDKPNFDRPKVTHKPRSVPNDEWWLKVLPECSDHLAALLLFMTVTGARISEAIRLMPEDVDEDARTALLGKTKTGKPRVVSIPDSLWARMAPLLDTEGPVFRYASRHSVADPLRNACKRAGVRHHSTHEIGRHSFATALLKAGASLAHVKELGGWETGRLVSDTYGHLERKDAGEMLEDIAAKRSPKVRKVE